MRAKSKLLLIVAIMLLGLTTATIINVSLNFREYSINNAVEKARMTAAIVKDGLTAHMVNGIMDKRQYFLDQISHNNNKIKSLWIIRSKNVIKQYGEGFPNETVRDAIDKKVIQSGKISKIITEHTDGITLRVTIPYKARASGGENSCLTCHDVKVGDTLGAISMEFDITSMRSTGMFTIIKILGLNIIFLIVVLILINYYVSPYTKLFSSLQVGIKKAYSGDFTHEFSTTISGDAKKIVDRMNILFRKMQETFGDIKHTLGTFIPQGCVSSSDPLYEAKTIIEELADIYKFKKTIELDASKADVYGRIIDILRLKYKLNHFLFYEINNITSERKIIYNTEEKSICYGKTNKDAMECRAHRTKTVTVSSEFPNLCKLCASQYSDYVCIPFSINNDISITISIIALDEENIEQIKPYISSVKHYLEAAKPVIESQILMEKLRDTSLRDGMTNLYNRRFLEELIDKIMSQAERNNDHYSILMLDVDFFKMVNDTHGHDVGDKVIVQLAKILKDSIREADLAIRYGGEEFIVMLHNATDEGTLSVANKIHSSFGNFSFNVGASETLKKTISIGIAKFSTDGDTIWKTIKYADTALYEAKNTGRNKIVEFTKEMYKSGENF
ncbi:MAG: GGDEF domain-containing protein [Sulfurimonas sp.]|nr:MAG: GGDEF domain-containing protein [Sulfurimonas sp.]